MSFKYQLSLSGLLCFPIYFMTAWSVQWRDGVLKSLTIIVLLSIYPGLAASICLMYWGAPVLGT